MFRRNILTFVHRVVICRWQKLKAALVERRSKLGESQNIQQVTRDAEDIEAWISEKLQSVQDESYMDPSNLQVRTPFVYDTKCCIALCERTVNASSFKSLNSRPSLPRYFWFFVLMFPSKELRLSLTYITCYCLNSYRVKSKNNKHLKQKWPPTKKGFCRSLPQLTVSCKSLSIPSCFLLKRGKINLQASPPSHK